MSCNVAVCGPYSLGCYAACASIKTEIVAQQTGIHRIEYTHDGITDTWTFGAVKGFGFNLPNKFKEVGGSCFKIVQPDGYYFEYFNQTSFAIRNTATINHDRPIEFEAKKKKISPPIDYRPKIKPPKASTAVKFEKKTPKKKISTPVKFEDKNNTLKNKPLEFEERIPKKKISTPVNFEVCVDC